VHVSCSETFPDYKRILFFKNQIKHKIVFRFYTKKEKKNLLLKEDHKF